MIEGSGSIPLTNGSRSRRTKSYGFDGSGSFGSGSATLHLKIQYCPAKIEGGQDWYRYQSICLDFVNNGRCFFVHLKGYSRALNLKKPVTPFRA